MKKVIMAIVMASLALTVSAQTNYVLSKVDIPIETKPILHVLHDTVFLNQSDAIKLNYEKINKAFETKDWSRLIFVGVIGLDKFVVQAKCGTLHKERDRLMILAKLYASFLDRSVLRGIGLNLGNYWSWTNTIGTIGLRKTVYIISDNETLFMNILEKIDEELEIKDGISKYYKMNRFWEGIALQIRISSSLSGRMGIIPTEEKDLLAKEAFDKYIQMGFEDNTEEALWVKREIERRLYTPKELKKKHRRENNSIVLTN